MKIVQALLAEHVVFHTLFDYLERATPRLKTVAEVRALADLLASMLEEHSVVEDQLLIEPLEPSFCQLGQDRNFHEEHEEIERHLASIHTTRKLATAKRLLILAVTWSRKHFDKEERIVFPLAQKQLSARSQELLGKHWTERRKLAVDQA
jgi:hemerythrin-like domain-containing protein